MSDDKQKPADKPSGEKDSSLTSAFHNLHKELSRSEYPDEALRKDVEETLKEARKERTKKRSDV